MAHASESTMPRSRGGFWRRTVDLISSSSTELEDAELMEDAQAAGCRPISQCGDRAEVDVHGFLRTVTLRPRGDVSTLEAELYDGSATVLLIWLGRRRIPGIEPGRALTVRGRIAESGGQRVLYNPRYELAAA